VATFAVPSEREVALPADTIFPTDHFQKVLARARAGEHFVSHRVFDGAGFDSLTQITSVIGKPQAATPLARNPTDGGGARAWPVSMAYYDLQESDETPKFEAAFLLGENGVLREVVLDYGEFRLNATLEKLDLLDRPDC
jgi:hypothetical protein